MDAGDFDKAIECFKLSNKTLAHFKTLELWGECEMKLGNIKASIMPLTAAMELNSSLKPASLLAKAYSDLGDSKRAIELAGIVLNKAPNNKLAKQVMACN
ncbi:hypothetical protein A9Q81_27660 [Gammaproteobacteria bacterium 42_54_T18]|nr:hypothetical protein A9Q81_27660 [Gammaproteobacteria bacterium 42_54_T18]